VSRGNVVVVGHGTEFWPGRDSSHSAEVDGVGLGNACANRVGPKIGDGGADEGRLRDAKLACGGRHLSGR